MDSVIPDDDLLWETFDPVPPGGQQVLRRSLPVKVTHLPTGMVAICDLGGSQHHNRRVALDMLLGGLTSPHLR